MKAICLVAVTLFTVSTAWAAKPPPQTFEEIDVNGDGYISKKEAKVRKDITKQWKSIDQNGDGKIDSKEWEIYAGKNRYVPPDDTIEQGIGAAPTQ